ncbi:MAG: efflux RND transporter periplasmic adaptor subunit [Mucinivorans sp.]
MKYYIIIAAALLVSCGGEANTESEHKQGEAGHEAAPSQEIVLSPKQLETFGIESQTIEKAPFNDVIRAGGRILPSSNDQSIIAATTTGIVSFVGPLNLGSKVSQGRALFTISADKLPDGEPAARVKINYLAAEKAYERAKTLAADKIVSERDLETAELNYRTAKIAYQAQKESVSKGGITVSAPISGYITSIDVTSGAYVTTGTPLGVMAKNQRLTLRADVAASNFSKLGAITKANFRPWHSQKVYSTDQMNGRKVASSSALTNGSSFLTVDFEVDNRGELLPGSLIDLYLIGAPRSEVLAVPESAILEQEGHFFLMIRLDEECFEKREVTLGASDGTRREVLSGLMAGEQVVSQGAFQVKMAASGTAIPDGHNH